MLRAGRPRHLVQRVYYAHISPPGIFLCVKMGNMNEFVGDSSNYLFWFHIINQSGNALLASQSEEVTSSSHFRAVDLPPPPPPPPPTYITPLPGPLIAQF